MKKIFLITVLMLVCATAFSYMLTITVTSNAGGTGHIKIKTTPDGPPCYEWTEALLPGENVFHKEVLPNDVAHITMIKAVGFMGDTDTDTDSDTSYYGDPYADLEVDIDGAEPSAPPQNQ